MKCIFDDGNDGCLSGFANYCDDPDNPKFIDARRFGFYPGEVCEACFKYKPFVENPLAKSAANEQLLEDYKKLYLLMEHAVDTARAMLNALRNDIDALLTANQQPIGFEGLVKDPAADSKTIRLGRILERYESLCHFPTNRYSVPGLLDKLAFEKLPEYGFSKDPGPGAVHGDLTHRLQWHVVMRVVTCNFTMAIAPGWHHSALQLYHSFSRDDVIAAGYWGVIFDDNAGGNKQKAPTSFRNPDVVHEEMRKLENGAKRSNPIGSHLNKRFEKRKKVDDALLKRVYALSDDELGLKDKKGIVLGIDQDVSARHSARSQIHAEAGSFVRTWRKTGLPESLPQSRGGKIAKEVFDELNFKPTGAGVFLPLQGEPKGILKSSNQPLQKLSSNLTESGKSLSPYFNYNGMVPAPNSNQPADINNNNNYDINNNNLN